MTRLRLLHVEDDPIDAEMIHEALRSEAFALEVRRVQTARELESTLAAGEVDLVLCDNTMPAFDGRSALAIVRRQSRVLPFLFVTGTLGEERAVEMLRAGATDIVFKDRLERLAPAVRRALAESVERRARLDAERALAASRRFVEHVLEASPQAVFVWSRRERRLVYATARLGEILGLPANSLTDLPLRRLGDLLPPRDGRVLLEAMRRLAASPETVVRRELGLRRADGEERALEVRLVAFGGGSEALEQVLGTAEDVTELKQLEARLLRNQRLEAIGSVAGGIAHDLNNILTPIVMATELLAPEVPTRRGRELLATIEESATRGSELVRHILGFARGSERRQAPLQVGALLEEIVRLVETSFPRSIDVRLGLESDLKRVLGDPTALYQVFLNLVTNARDAMPDGGRLLLAASSVRLREGDPALDPDAAPGEFVRVRVEDSGSGIPKAVQQRIFDPFFTTKPEGKGTGLGLATSRAIVRAHRGSLDFRTGPGGTVFDVYLPVLRAGA